MKQLSFHRRVWEILFSWRQQLLNLQQVAAVALITSRSSCQEQYHKLRHAATELSDVLQAMQVRYSWSQTLRQPFLPCWVTAATTLEEQQIMFM